MCRSCQALSLYFYTCWWNPANIRYSSIDSSSFSLSYTAPRSVICVITTMRKVGIKNFNGTIASWP
jgi:hypothetical protein